MGYSNMNMQKPHQEHAMQPKEVMMTLMEGHPGTNVISANVVPTSGTPYHKIMKDAIRLTDSLDEIMDKPIYYKNHPERPTTRYPTKVTCHTWY